MILLGGDISTTSPGFCVVNGEQLVAAVEWKAVKNQSRPDALDGFERAMRGWIQFQSVMVGGFDAAVVEEPGGGKLGFRTVRSMGHFEGVTLMMLARFQIAIRQVKAGKARNVVFGCKITINKEEAHALAIEKWPWLSEHSEHIIDAYVQTQAWPIMLKKGLA